MSEPTTKAGRALLGTLRDRAAHVPGEVAMVSAINSVEDAIGLIPQIEQQAAAAERKQIAEEYGLDLDDEGDGIPPDVELSYHIVDIPVVNGIATLPDGRTVRSTANVVRVPVLDESEGVK